jgi:hypothetical protein
MGLGLVLAPGEVVLVALVVFGGLVGHLLDLLGSRNGTRVVNSTPPM